MWQVVFRVTTTTCETLRAAKCHRPPPPPFLLKLLLLLLTKTTTTTTMLLLQNKPKCAQGLHAALFYEVLIEDSNFSSDEGQSRALQQVPLVKLNSSFTVDLTEFPYHCRS